jgi:hypothetical protein
VPTVECDQEIKRLKCNTEGYEDCIDERKTVKEKPKKVNLGLKRALINNSKLNSFFKRD